MLDDHTHEPEMNLPTINQDTIREIMMSSEATNVIESFVNEQREMALILARLTNPAEQICGAAFLWEALKREVGSANRRDPEADRQAFHRLVQRHVPVLLWDRRTAHHPGAAILLCVLEGRGGKSYDYAVLERALGPAVAWLMIGKLCGAYIFEYGTSPRYAWLTQRGEALNAYLEGKTDDQLVELVTETDQDYIFCYPDRCNCDQPCNNPLFT
jgi:hypothetical protein